MSGTQGNLNRIVEETLKANKRTLRNVEKKVGNLETRENNTKTRFKKGLVYGAIISALLLGSYGGCKGLRFYNSYKPSEKAKVTYYQDRFNQVKHYYSIRDYMKADDLSEKLQGDMGEESYFSSTRNLYKEVKKYDNEFIDPEVRRIKREKLYRDIKAFPGKVWGSIPSGGKFIIYASGIGLIIYLLRRRGYKE